MNKEFIQNTIVNSEIIFPNLSTDEYNFLICIIDKISNLNRANTYSNMNTVLTFTLDEIKKIASYSNNKDLDTIINDFKSSFFIKTFTIFTQERDNGLLLEQNLFLINEYAIYKQAENNAYFQIKLEINKNIAYLLMDMFGNFNNLELEEFFNLKNKYSKAIYRLLKQAKISGKCLIYSNSWDRFKNYLQVPQSYAKTSMFNVRVLKPAYDELSKIFKNLEFKIIKDTKSRGNKIIGIEFYFAQNSISYNEFIGNIEESNNTSYKPQINPNAQEETQAFVKPQEIKPIAINEYNQVSDYISQMNELQTYIGLYYYAYSEVLNTYEPCKITAAKTLS